MDKIAHTPTQVLASAAGTPRARGGGLWWYVHYAAHQRCGSGWGCERQRFFGHQIMYLLRGRGSGRYQGQSWSAGAGEAVLLDLGQPHAYFADPRDPWEMCWVILDGPGVPEVFEGLLREAGSPVIPFASRARLRRDFRALLDLLADRPPGYDGRIWHHLTGLVANVAEGLCRAGGEVDHSLAGLPPGVAAALGHLRLNHQRPLALRELARKARLSPFHFLRRFKQATGFTPLEYLEKFRIDRAQELLLTRPELRLKEIALAVGYEDPAYFSRVFRKRLGLAPRAYRGRLRGQGLAGRP